MRNKIIWHLNLAYSQVWITITGTDKHEYRNKSRVHAALMSMLSI